jgi:5-oxoprolinase (ATP-hydrolysing) subunit A
MGQPIDLNSDLGESWGAYTMGDDAAVLSIVTSANVACGFHAGDPNVMRAAVATAVKHGVGIGAHPSYDDLWGFGRRRIAGDSPAELEHKIAYQIGALMGIAALDGGRVTHVKAHGSLGNVVQEDDAIADAVARAVKSVDPGLILVVMPGLAAERAVDRAGLRMVREAYADRAYQDDGNLVSRKQTGAVLHDPEEAAARVVRMLADGCVTSVSGRRIPGRIDSICVHGDNPAAVTMARQVRDAVVAAGYDVRPFHTFV